MGASRLIMLNGLLREDSSDMCARWNKESGLRKVEQGKRLTQGGTRKATHARWNKESDLHSWDPSEIRWSHDSVHRIFSQSFPCRIGALPFSPLPPILLFEFRQLLRGQLRGPLLALFRSLELRNSQRTRSFLAVGLGLVMTWPKLLTNPRTAQMRALRCIFSSIISIMTDTKTNHNVMSAHERLRRDGQFMFTDNSLFLSPAQLIHNALHVLTFHLPTMGSSDSRWGREEGHESRLLCLLQPLLFLDLRRILAHFLLNNLQHKKHKRRVVIDGV